MKNNKILSVLLLVLAVTFIAVSCGGSDSSASADYDDSKVLHRSIVAKIRPFDPAGVSDRYTNTIFGEATETLFAYEYLADTYNIMPQIATEMPTVSADGLTYTIKLRTDAFFYDPLMEVFPEGKGRAVNAHDFVYSVKRLADPAVQSTGWWLFEGKIKGLDEWGANGADYSAEVEGFKAIDDTTIQLTVNEPYPQILYTFAMPYTIPLPKEMVDFYGEEFPNYVIGTGAYYYDHEETIPGSQYVFKKNPTYREVTFPSASTAGPKTIEKLGMETLKEFEGQLLPLMDKVIFYVIEESSVNWLKFMNGELDYGGIPKDNFDSAMPGGELSPEMVEKGLTVDINGTLDITYIFFNFLDADGNETFLAQNPLVRQAMAAAYNHEEVVEIFYNGRALPAQTLVPPGLGGYDPNYKNPYATYNPELAKELLVEAGYPEGEGIPEFTYTLYSSAATSVQMYEYFAQNMAEIGITVNSEIQDWPTFSQSIDNRQVEIGGIAWGADYPDAQNFLQLHYGPNSAPGPNGANYNNPEFNALYEQGAFMQPSAERDAIYKTAAQFSAEDAPWIMGVHRLSYALDYPWLKTRVFRDIGQGYSKYLYVDIAEREAATK